MSRPWVLVFLLLLIVFTSQFEWKQQFGSEVEPNPNKSVTEHEEAVKEKIILSQEKKIQKLNVLVHTLHQQLNQCRHENDVNRFASLAEILSDLELQPILED